MPAYQAWGYDDVGVWIDWCCLPQVVGGVPRTTDEDLEFSCSATEGGAMKARAGALPRALLL